MTPPHRMPAVEEWTHRGLTCRIAPGPFCLNGYVHAPPGLIPPGTEHHLDVHGGVTYGPDDDGWIGFDTGHGGDYWAPDDLEGHITEPFRRAANEIRRMASNWPDAHRWTLAELRTEPERLARQIAAASETQNTL